MFVYCQVEQAEEIHEQMRALEEEMLQKCGLAYRVIDTAAGDLGTSAARKFDCEAWVPTQGTLPRADLRPRTAPPTRHAA